MSERRLLTIAIPVRNEEANIPTLISAIDDLTEKLESKGVSTEIIINENASTDKSLRLLQEWESKNSKLKVVPLLTPLTFQGSILAMMKRSSGDAFVILQSDLQDPPNLILTFVEHWIKGEEIVVGVISSRREGKSNQIGRKLFYRTLRAFSDGHFIGGFQDFYLISKRVYSELANLPSEGLFLRGHISSRFGPLLEIPYVRNSRVAGKTNFHFVQKYTLALDGILLFGTRFVRVVSTLSFMMFLFSTIFVSALTLSFLLGIRFPLKGWLSIVAGILAIMSILGLALGLILEYLIRIYRFLILNNRR